MICKHCGQRLRYDSVFCLGCGKPQAVTAPKEPAKPVRRAVHTFGPYQLMSDGSIVGVGGTPDFPPAMHFGRIEIDGHTLEKGPSGSYTHRTARGDTTVARFDGGEWNVLPSESKTEKRDVPLMVMCCAALLIIIGAVMWARTRTEETPKDSPRPSSKFDDASPIASSKASPVSSPPTASEPSDIADLRSRTIARLAVPRADLDPAGTAKAVREEAAENRRKIDEATEAIRKNPRDGEAYVKRAMANFALNEFDAAIDDYSEAIRLAPSDSAGYVSRAEIRVEKGDNAGAIADYTVAIRLRPNDGEAYLSRAIARRAKGDHAGAIADCTEAIRLNGDRSFAYEERAATLAGKGDYAGAVVDYSMAIRLGRVFNHDMNYVDRGDAYSALRKYAEAITDYSEAIRLYPKGSTYYRKRGDARAALKDFDGAKADYLEAIRIGPQPPRMDLR